VQKEPYDFSRLRVLEVLGPLPLLGTLALRDCHVSVSELGPRVADAFSVPREFIERLSVVYCASNLRQAVASKILGLWFSVLLTLEGVHSV
jgi:hypothetical protein